MPLRLRRIKIEPVEPARLVTPGQPVRVGADITELFPPPGPVPDHVKGADITQLFPEPPPPPLPPELLFPQQQPSPSEGVSTPDGDTPHSLKSWNRRLRRPWRPSRRQHRQNRKRLKRRVGN